MRENRAQDNVLTRYAESLICFKARQLTRHPGFTSSDQDDLEQELWTMLLTRCAQFDPDRASINTFIDCVVNASVRMILRARRCQKRADGLQARSLNSTSVGPGDSLITQLSESDQRRRQADVPHNGQSQAETSEAIEFALTRMPQEVRNVCRHIMKGTVNSAARELGTSRRQIRNRLAQARRWLEREGITHS